MLIIRAENNQVYEVAAIDESTGQVLCVLESTDPDGIAARQRLVELGYATQAEAFGIPDPAADGQ